MRLEEVGLTLEAGRVLVRSIDGQVVADQGYPCTLCFRECPGCSVLRQVNDTWI